MPLSDHVKPEDLHELLSGNLESQRAREAVAHLLRGCASCWNSMLPEIVDLLFLAQPDADLPPELDTAYDAAISRALEGARRKTRRGRPGVEGLLEAPQRLRGLASIDDLLQRSWESRQDDPQQMLHFALLAAVEAGQLSPGVLAEAHMEDVRCRAALELGNAYRVADRLNEAEELLHEADEHFRRGTGDSHLKARLLDVQASLYGDQRAFDLCFEALDGAIALYRELNESHLVGRALITKAVHTRYAKEPARAIELLREGLSLIDPEKDPKLAVNAVHNLAWMMVDHGRFREARRILWESQPQNGKYIGHLDRLKARWLEGRVNAGLGKLDLAERDLQTAREGLAAAGLAYTAAIAALDLAEVELLRNQSDKAAALALQSIEVFLSLEIGREARMAVLSLERAIRRRLISGAVIREVADLLRQTEGDAKARFEG